MATEEGTSAAPAWRVFVTCVDVTEPVCRLASCRAPLTGRRTAYCSDKHAREFERNHLWWPARTAARRRAKGACERCGFKPAEARRDPATKALYRRYELRLEVNHIEPLVGGYRLFTCMNHLSNLEVLCHSCHLLATKEQRVSRGAAG